MCGQGPHHLTIIKIYVIIYIQWESIIIIPNGISDGCRNSFSLLLLEQNTRRDEVPFAAIFEAIYTEKISKSNWKIFEGGRGQDAFWPFLQNGIDWVFRPRLTLFENYDIIIV